MQKVHSILLVQAALILGCTFAGLNPYNPNYNYPETHVVDKAAVNIPYQGDIHTGYITVNDTTKSKLFYMVYPAGGSNSATTLNNSKPLILWLQGGPGCSDGAGNYLEIGPLSVKNNSGVLTPTLRDVNWNDDYNLLFVDSPIGVGFSVSGNENPDNAWDTAQYLQVFLIRFFQIYSSLYANDFYIFGESFGGHYIPALSTILVQNHTQNGINLKGIGVGDGWTDPITQVAAFSDYCFSTGLLDENQREKIHQMEVQAQQYIQNQQWSMGSQYFDYITGNITAMNANVDIYNFEMYNFPENDPYDTWLNTTVVKNAYGVDPSVTYQDCVDSTYYAFYPDIAQSYAQNYSYLLNQNILPDLRIMLYSGQNDIICNTIGTLRYVPNLNWLPIKIWQVTPRSQLQDNQGTVVGFYKHYSRFTFSILYDAGHLAPMDQPKSARIMLQRFISDSYEQAEDDETLISKIEDAEDALYEFIKHRKVTN